jgi:hypothetical protein
MPETKTLIYVGVGIVAVVAVVSVIAVVAKKENPVTVAKDRIVSAVRGAPRAPRRVAAIDWDATASMWEDEDEIYHRASALDKRGHY